MFSISYWPPQGDEYGFNYYYPWSVDQPFQSDPTIDYYNAPEKVDWIVHHISELLDHQTSQKHFYLPWGEDYDYENAYSSFHEVDQMIKYVNQFNTANIEMVYSTPSKYLKAINDEKLAFPIITKDFWHI